MLDITTIILTYNEELHIRRCLENVCSFAKKVYVIDSPSTDGTVEICKDFSNVEVIVHKYPGNQAEQFNWALDNIKIETEWVLRLDADEYLMPELVKELQKKLPNLPANVYGVTFKRRHIFLGHWMRHGTYPVMILRLFRRGKAVCEQRLMDEHIELRGGKNVTFEHDFVDHNLNNLSWWSQKHVNYSVREAAELLDLELGLTEFSANNKDIKLKGQAKNKRIKKLKYARQPLFWRAFAYFCYRYFFKLGFLEGKEGFLWHFLQGWWYRTLVDAKIYEIKKACGNDKEKIKLYLKENYNIVL